MRRDWLWISVVIKQYWEWNIFTRIGKGAKGWLDIYYWDAGLAVTGRVRNIEKNVLQSFFKQEVESSWNVIVHGDAREGKLRRNWRMEWVANTLHSTSEHGVSSITTADVHTSAASSGLNWRPLPI